MDENRALIYNIQEIKDQLTTSEFTAALSAFEVGLVMEHPLYGVRAMEIVAPDNRFAESECWEAGLEGKALTLVPIADPVAVKRNPDLPPGKPIEKPERLSLIGLVQKAFAEAKAAKEAFAEAKAAKEAFAEAKAAKEASDEQPPTRSPNK